MKTTRIALCIALLASPVVSLADEVTCESIDRRQVECPMNTSGVIRVSRQLSRTACVEDVNWGLFKHAVWVKDGCRAVFSSGEPDQGNRQPSYAVGFSGRPACANADGNEVTCESIDNRRTECPMNTRGRVTMTRQLSRTACTEDVNWGLSKHSVWVSGGCRATFRNEGAGANDPDSYSGDDRAPARAMRACNDFADQGYDGTVLSQSAMKPGWWEIILRFEDYRYVCNVSSNGQVDSFNKLN